MTLNSHFYIQRMVHASLPDILCRIQQTAALFSLRWLKKLNSRSLKAPEIEKGHIEKLCMPTLIPENNSGSLDLASLIDPERLLNPWRCDAESIRSDIRIRWEAARLQKVTALIIYAQHFQEAVDIAQAKHAARGIILHWIDANPFLQSEHYQSAMECALRVPVFFYALKCLRCLTSREYNRIRDAIYLHALLISKRLSLYSSLGNHTITEAVGLVFAGAVFNNTIEGKQWIKDGLSLLSNEQPHQILDDGGPAERSFTYHRFVLDLYWLAMDFIQKNNLGNVADWKPRLMKGESFLEAFKDRDGTIPSIGDSDDGFAVAPGFAPARGEVRSTFTRSETFKQSGYSIVKDGGIYLTFDHGSLGMPPLYNHGHADALSITISRHNKPFLVDSGTYRYNGVEPWRIYFKGTKAHNTVTIDGLDQAIQETSFIWSKPFQSKLAYAYQDDHQLFLSAIHDGYNRLENPVYHQRSILVYNGAYIIIQDRFSGKGAHQFELNYHLHPDVDVKKKGKWWELDNGGVCIFMRLLNEDFHKVSGADSPILGWFSPNYGTILPTTTLTHTTRGEAEVVILKTAIFTRKPSV